MTTTTTTTTTSFPPGIYHIVVAGTGIVSQRLSRGHSDDGKGYVTILPPIDDNKNVHQEWQIEDNEDGTEKIISSPHAPHVFPTAFLTYKGAPEKPKAGDGIEAFLADVPENKWSLKPTGDLASFIQVVGSDLGIAVAPRAIHPPLVSCLLTREKMIVIAKLVLNENEKLKWRLQFLRFSE